MMNTTSNKKMTNRNRVSCLIRIQKELQYVVSKTTIGEKNLRKAIYYLVESLQEEK